MPELPEVEALAQFLRSHAVGGVVARVDVASLSALETADPPISALTGRDVTGATRIGKYLALDCDGLWLVVHLSRAGWLHWRDAPPAAPPKLGRGPIALRVHLVTPDAEMPAFDLTEAGTRKRLAIWVVEDPHSIDRVATLGPDALAVDRDAFAALLADRSGRLKTVLTDQRILAGIGNAYSDEILHTARLSPFATASRLTDDEVDALFTTMRAVLEEAVARSVGQDAARLKGEKRSGLRVHGRTGMPCPVCGDTVREVAYTDRSFQYCPTCQTQGKVLADRRMSRLLK